jgi:putative nucleotidyltransferase with HDIG domain
MDALHPKSLLIRYLDLFEIPFGELDEQAISWANKYLDAASASTRTFNHLPVEDEGRYIGSLLIVRSKGGLSLQNLRPLADGIVGCAMYIEARIKSDENWASIMISLSKAVDAKSTWTNGHSERVANLAVTIGEKLLMEEGELERLRISALLHDVGKIAVPESILDKPGKLSDEEMEIMRQHPERGARIVEETPGYEEIRQAIMYHHERWDGRGYPHGISEKVIPLHARIIAIADVFDALTSDRPLPQG